MITYSDIDSLYLSTFDNYDITISDKEELNIDDVNFESIYNDIKENTSGNKITDLHLLITMDNEGYITDFEIYYLVKKYGRGVWYNGIYDQDNKMSFTYYNSRVGIIEIEYMKNQIDYSKDTFIHLDKINFYDLVEYNYSLEDDLERDTSKDIITIRIFVSYLKKETFIIPDPNYNYYPSYFIDKEGEIQGDVHTIKAIGPIIKIHFTNTLVDETSSDLIFYSIN